MSSFTNFLNLFKWNPVEDEEEEFNIDKALNENWDKIDKKMEQHVRSTSLIHANVTQTKDGFMSKEDKQKINNIENNAQANIIEKIKKNGTEIEITNKEVNIELKKDDVGLNNVDNTSDLDKPISKLQKEEFDKKVDKEDGKVLSSNDFTNKLKEKLEKETVPTGGTTGQVLTKNSDKDNDVGWTDQTGQGGATGDTLPIGSIMPYPKTTSPENWLVCDGSAVSRTTYSELFNVIGEDFGAGDGSTTFNLPNIKGKTVVGLDTSDTDFNVIGKTIGEKTHKLTVDEMPSHTHGIGIEYTVVSGSDTPRLTSNPQNATCMTSATGNNQPHNNLQPSIVQNYIIKAKQSSGVVATVVDNLDSTSSTDALSANQGKNLNDKITGTVLYEDSEGTSENITLNETVANFDYIDISFETNQNKTHTERVYTPNEKNLTVNIGNVFDPNGIYQLAVAGLKINGNYLEWTYNGYVNMPHGSTCFIGSNSYYTKIVSVIGYKNS